MFGIKKIAYPLLYRIAAGTALVSAASPAHSQKSIIMPAPAPEAHACAAASGSASSAVASSAGLTNGTALLQASFDTQDWSGDLKSFLVSTGADHYCAVGTTPSAGELCQTPSWSAATRLLSQSWNTGRTILTYSRTARSGIPFRVASLDDHQIAQLKTTAAESAEPAVVNRVAYLRGDRTQDGSAATPRNRHDHVLGDIINSAPVFVGAPSANYGDPTYAAFRTSSLYRGRPPMAYVAANDGMLHGFDASNGGGGGYEKFAYVPDAAFGTGSRQPLLGLTQIPFSHEPIVDGALQVVDARINKTWASVLVGSLGQGGRAIYALDVSNPAAITEGNPGTVLWEFTSQDDGDLGYTGGTPSIVKMKNGQWAAIFGNGYSTAADATASGRACLFISFLEGPAVTGWAASGGGRYQKICTGVGDTAKPNGLASPAAVDVDRNPDEAVDFIYAGDERGNLWRFDVKDANPANWKVGYGGNPLFTAKDDSGNPQPITGQPEVGYNLSASAATSVTDPKLTIYFGTGRYRRFGTEPSGNATTGVQTFYAIFDGNLAVRASSAVTPAATRSQLLRQSIVQEVDAAGRACVDSGPQASGPCFRVTTGNALAAADRGWFIDLYNTADNRAASVSGNAIKTYGEQQTSTPILRNGRIIFTTLVPPEDDCGPGGGWLMELDARSGSRTASPAFNTGTDRMVNQDDFLTVDGMKVAASGSRSNIGMPSSPVIINVSTASGLQVEQFSGSGRDGKTFDSVLDRTGNRNGRITWREIQQ